MRSQWGLEYPGSMRSIERGMSSIRSERGENGLQEINGGEISGHYYITGQRTDALQ